MINTTNAIITKFIIAPSNAPQPITIGPNFRVAACQAPPGIKGVTSGITKLSTIDLINAVAATPIINAIANGTALRQKSTF